MLYFSIADDRTSSDDPHSDNEDDEDDDEVSCPSNHNNRSRFSRGFHCVVTQGYVTRSEYF